MSSSFLQHAPRQDRRESRASRKVWRGLVAGVLTAALPGAILPTAVGVGIAATMDVPAARADTPAPEATEARLRRIESELRAVQRKVFPDGAGRTFAPEITPTDSSAATSSQASTSTAMSDLMARMDAVESQLKALTGASEENQHHIAKLEDRIATLEATAAPPAAAPAAVDGDLPPAPAPAKPAKGKAAKPVTEKPAPEKPVADKPVATKGKTTEKGSDKTAEASMSPDRVAALAAIERPSSDDAGEDTYTYGYRLWEAKFLPEAETALLDFVQKYPKHKRISYARNLLGRAYLDDNKPGAAAQWFAQNYQADKAADRAPDSLLYLAVAMAKLKQPQRACIALGEFKDTYPTESTGRLKGQFDAVSKTVACH